MVLFYFVRLQGRQAVYVDFENAPPIDANNPPDLKAVADGAQPVGAATDQPSQSSGAAKTAPAEKASKKAPKAKSSSVKKEVEGDDPSELTKTLLAKVRTVHLRHCGACTLHELRLQPLCAYWHWFHGSIRPNFVPQDCIKQSL